MNPLDIMMVANDAGASTLREYLFALIPAAWEEKRPFGNSGWHHEIYNSLARAGLIEATVAYQDEDYIEYDYDVQEGERFMMDLFKKLTDPAMNADHALKLSENREELSIHHPPLCKLNESCPISEAAKTTWIPEPDKPGLYPVWVEAESGELKIGD